MTRENNWNYLDLEDFETLVSQLIEAKEEFSEDIPLFSTRYVGKLEGIIAQIQAEYFGEEFYKSLEEKAAMLFYLIIKIIHCLTETSASRLLHILFFWRQIARSFISTKKQFRTNYTKSQL